MNAEKLIDIAHRNKVSFRLANYKDPDSVIMSYKDWEIILNYTPEIYKYMSVNPIKGQFNLLGCKIFRSHDIEQGELKFFKYAE